MIGSSRSIQNKIDSLITWEGIKNTSLSRQLNSQLQLFRDVFLSITRHLSMNWPISIFVWKVHFCNYYLLSPLRLLESSKSWITKQQSNFHICLRLKSPASLTNLIWWNGKLILLNSGLWKLIKNNQKPCPKINDWTICSTIDNGSVFEAGEFGHRLLKIHSFEWYYLRTHLNIEFQNQISSYSKW